MLVKITGLFNDQPPGRTATVVVVRLVGGACSFQWRRGVDVLLNVDVGQPGGVQRHRHPCFFGTMEEVIQGRDPLLIN